MGPQNDTNSLCWQCAIENCKFIIYAVQQYVPLHGTCCLEIWYLLNATAGVCEVLPVAVDYYDLSSATFVICRLSFAVDNRVHVIL
jgi:hypothetical protein